MDKELKKKYIKWSIITIVAIAILIPIILNFNKIVELASDPHKIKTFVLGYGNLSFLVFILIQIIQIVVFFIPGEVVQFAGGYIYGPYISFLLCITGVIIGSAITFSITKKFGKPFVEKIISEDSLWIVKKLEEAKHHRDEKHPEHKKKMRPRTIIFILYLIPGIPKDILGYISGISDMSLKEFLIFSTIARSPALFVSCFFGDKLTFILQNLKTRPISFWVVIVVGLAILGAGIYFVGKIYIRKMKEM